MSRSREGTEAHSVVQDINDLSESLSAVNDLQVMFPSLPCEFLTGRHSRESTLSLLDIKTVPLAQPEADEGWEAGQRAEGRC